MKNLIKALRSKILTYNVANFLVSIILFYDQRAFVILATKVKKLHLFFSLGFSTWLVQYLVTLRGLPVWVINLIVSIIAAIMTEVVSNTATANVLLPILWEMSLTICQNPTYLGNNVTDKMFLLALGWCGAPPPQLRPVQLPVLRGIVLALPGAELSKIPHGSHATGDDIVLEFCTCETLML